MKIEIDWICGEDGGNKKFTPNSNYKTCFWGSVVEGRLSTG